MLRTEIENGKTRVTMHKARQAYACEVGSQADPVLAITLKDTSNDEVHVFIRKAEAKTMLCTLADFTAKYS